MTERTEVIGNLITDSIYALYENSKSGETFILNKSESVIEDEIVSHIRDLDSTIKESDIREKISLYLFMSPAKNECETLCRIL